MPHCDCPSAVGSPPANSGSAKVNPVARPHVVQPSIRVLPPAVGRGLAEHRGRPHRILHQEADKPALQQIVVQLLHQLPLRKDAVVAEHGSVAPVRSTDGRSPNTARPTAHRDPAAQRQCLADHAADDSWELGFRRHIAGQAIPPPVHASHPMAMRRGQANQTAPNRRNKLFSGLPAVASICERSRALT